MSGRSCTCDHEDDIERLLVLTLCDGFNLRSTRARGTVLHVRGIGSDSMSPSLLAVK